MKEGQNKVALWMRFQIHKLLFLCSLNYKWQKITKQFKISIPLPVWQNWVLSCPSICHCICWLTAATGPQSVHQTDKVDEEVMHICYSSCRKQISLAMVQLCEVLHQSAWSNLSNECHAFQYRCIISASRGGVCCKLWLAAHWSTKACVVYK